MNHCEPRLTQSGGAPRVVDRFRSLKRAALATGALSIAAGLGCSVETRGSFGQKGQHLTTSDALRFDSAASWSSLGGTHSPSSISTEGTGSLHVTTSYYTELGASQLTTPSFIGDTFSFDLLAGQNAGWGELRVVASSSSHGFWHQLGAVSVPSLTTGAYQTITLTLAPEAKQSLSQSYSDLKLQFIFNAPPGVYWIDNGSFGEPDTCEDCTNSTCSDELLNGNETDVDCGGSCAPCGSAAAGIVWYDKFTEGLGNWTTSGFSVDGLAVHDDYAESGSGAPAATAQGTATLTSPAIDLSTSGSFPLLRFHRLLDAPAAGAALLQINVDGNWETIRDLGAEDAADNKWRTEFVQLSAYRMMTDFQFRFVTSGAQTTFQLDDVSISQRDAVDGSRVAPQSFLAPPGSLSPAAALSWQWRIDDGAEWNAARRGPFDSDSWPLPANSADPIDLFARATINIDSSEDLSRLVLWARWDDQLEVRVNGALVSDQDSWSPSFQMLTPGASGLLHGSNTIDVFVHDFGGDRFFDLGILRDPQRAFPEAINPPHLASGGSDPLAGFADAVKNYATTRDVPGVGFAVFKDGSLVVEGAYGYLDKAQTMPMPYNPVMRLASADKSYTIAAAAQLIAEGQQPGGFRLKNNEPLTRDTLIFPTLRNLYGFLADPNQAGDHTDQITVGHLMDHTSHVRNFWEGGEGDFHSVVGTSRGRTTRHDNALYIHQRGCENPPGSPGDGYNNGGYMLLRYFIDEITSSGLLDYLNHQVQADVFIDHEALLGRHSSEPWYETNQPPYDRWINLEHYTGLAATPRSLAELATKYHLQTGAAAPNGGVTQGCIERNGGMSGSTAWAGQCERNITYAFIINGLQQSGSYDDLRFVLRDYAASLADADYQ